MRWPLQPRSWRCLSIHRVRRIVSSCPRLKAVRAGRRRAHRHHLFPPATEPDLDGAACERHDGGARDGREPLVPREEPVLAPRRGPAEGFRGAAREERPEKRAAESDTGRAGARPISLFIRSFRLVPFGPFLSARSFRLVLLGSPFRN